jgi:hypothetical protein
MGKILALLSFTLFLVACGGSESAAPLPTRADTTVLNPRTLLVTTPELPPTWTPPPSIQPDHLAQPDQAAEIPADSGRPPYVVQAGDTLGEIATQFGVSLEALASVNGITDWDVIEVGTLLVIPAG